MTCAAPGASTVIMNGAEIVTVGKLLGHVLIGPTAIYARLARCSAKVAGERITEQPRFGVWDVSRLHAVACRNGDVIWPPVSASGSSIECAS